MNRNTDCLVPRTGAPCPNACAGEGIGGHRGKRSDWITCGATDKCQAINGNNGKAISGRAIDDKGDSALIWFRYIRNIARDLDGACRHGGRQDQLFGWRNSGRRFDGAGLAGFANDGYVAGVSNAIPIGIRLIRICNSRTVVDVIWHQVAVGIGGLLSVLVACVTDSISVGVRLIRIRGVSAIVYARIDTIPIGVRNWLDITLIGGIARAFVALVGNAVAI